MFDEHIPLLPDVFALHGQWRANWPAVVTQERTLSWAMFDLATNRIANALIGAGTRKGDRVVLLMSNCCEMVELIVGIMKAGCVSVPLNVSVTDDSAAAMVKDSGARFVFVTADQASRVKPESEVVCIDVTAGSVTSESGHLIYSEWLGSTRDEAPLIPLAGRDVCNIIYSSGTTGEPKGIVHSHKARLLWAHDLALALRYHSGARALIVTGLYSNISWAALLCTFLVGGTLVLRNSFEAADTLATIERERITHTAMVPVQYRRLLEHPDFQTTDRSSMQAMMCVGSPCPIPLKQRLFDTFRCGVIELYGTTEGLITTLAPEEAPGRLTSVGRPLPGLDLRILGADDNPVAPGEAGEVVGRSRFVMSGYWKKPAATADAMWTDADGHSWLRSGDIGRLDEDGYVYILDRKKDMILSGGQNIYPADIEAILAQHPHVVECAVIAVPSAEWGESPLAFVVTNLQSINVDELRTWLNARVGKQQRVVAVEVCESLPRNPTGKILKRELRAPYWTQNQGVA